MLQIEPQLLSGKNVMIAAHGNSLRSIIMYLDKLTSQEVIGILRIVISFSVLNYETKESKFSFFLHVLTGHKFRIVNWNSNALHFQRGKIH